MFKSFFLIIITRDPHPHHPSVFSVVVVALPCVCGGASHTGPLCLWSPGPRRSVGLHHQSRVHHGIRDLAVGCVRKLADLVRFGPTSIILLMMISGGEGLRGEYEE